MKPISAILSVAALLMAMSGTAESVEPQATLASANIAAKGERTADWMRSAVEERLQETVVPPVIEWRITDINLPPAAMIPADFDEYRLTEGHAAANGKMRTIVFNFYKNGKFIKKLGVVCRLELFADIVVAKTTLRRGSVITREMLDIVRREVSLPADDFCTEIALVTGQQAKRTLRVRGLLRKSDLEPVPTIRSGEIVMIVADNGNIKITARGIAKSDGAMGETIPVLSLRSNKKIHGRVIGDGTVQVAF
jgi:flagella basal body P-ring formation protein FlgA